MFARGTRFPSSKVPEILGPGAYNPQDPDYDAYKRGAFLEKTNRFTEDKPSETPDPGAYDTEGMNGQNRPPTRTSNTTTTDRLTILQRKLEELERVHVEEKKAHHLEQERFKLELNRAQRTVAEQTERADKLKKQHELLDARVQELKKTGAAEQAELRDLRVKLRTSEHERTQLAAKQGDMTEARKAEARRKGELRERDKKIAELEKALAAERKKRETVEVRLQDAKAKTNEQVQEARAAAEAVESQLRDARNKAQAARDTLQRVETRAEDTEEELVAQLEQHRYALSRVAQEYGKLASTTIARSAHQRVKHELAALQLRNSRLERKLANSDGQVVELASLIRQVKEDNAFLTSQLREVQSEADVYRQTLRDTSGNARFGLDDLRDFYDYLLKLVKKRSAFDLDSLHAILLDLELRSTLDRERSDALLFHTSVLNKEVSSTHARLDQHAEQLSEAEATRVQLSNSLQRVQTEHAEAQRMLAETTASLAESNARAESAKKQLDVVQAETRAEIAHAEQGVQQEKQATRRLAASLQQAKQAEQFLRSEVEQLSSDLAEAEKYQEAYIGLLREVDALVVRNALAEDEAQRLSKFNAEILGHNNPAQRIVYVDRIRRELHETKQKLLLSTRDRDAAHTDNEDLRAELDLYKSVAIPQDVKPRTTIVRVARAPATTAEPDQPQGSSALRPVSGSRLASVPESPVVDVSDEMTLDEIV